VHEQNEGDSIILYAIARYGYMLSPVRPFVCLVV